MRAHPPHILDDECVRNESKDPTLSASRAAASRDRQIFTEVAALVNRVVFYVSVMDAVSRNEDILLELERFQCTIWDAEHRATADDSRARDNSKQRKKVQSHRPSPPPPHLSVPRTLSCETRPHPDRSSIWATASNDEQPESNNRKLQHGSKIGQLVADWDPLYRSTDIRPSSEFSYSPPKSHNPSEKDMLWPRVLGIRNLVVSQRKSRKGTFKL